MYTKVTGLTRANVLALDDAVHYGHLAGVATTRTTATFHGGPAEALARLDAARIALSACFSTRGHPVASLSAVRRKLVAARDLER
ncbi:hypothetical protein [Gordonia phage GTE5]|uniref:Uncharacterized protein n=1 Tax=Gordonia phage GTE5 TaxID=319522 RepID=G8EJU5_9CAUD|nr:hypothetical protein GoPhGTE5p78 [Gordonia phage GTE5]AET09827.1 hypothetical protein [Gordonia phage GTE5]